LEELLNRADAKLGGGVRAGGSAGANPPAGNIKRFKPESIVENSFLSFIVTSSLEKIFHVRKQNNSHLQCCCWFFFVLFSFTVETKTNKH
jgi:hypothetical protein